MIKHRIGKISLLLFFSALFYLLYMINYHQIFDYRYQVALHHLTDNKITVAPFFVWSLNSPDIPLSIFLGLAFPALYTLLNTRVLRTNSYILLSWLLVAVSIFYYALFAQEGKHYTDGNFGWSYMISMSFLYLFTIVDFFDNTRMMSLPVKYILFILLAIQLSIGLIYFTRLCRGPLHTL